MSITGEPDGPPAKPGPTLGDTGTGMLMCHQHPRRALRAEETGKGERLQVAMQDAMLHYIRARLRHPDAQGRTGAARRRPDRLGRQSAVRHLSRARAADRTTTSTSTPAAPIPSTGSGCWSVIGREDLIGDPRFETPQARIEHEAEIDAMIVGLDRASTTSTRHAHASAPPAFPPAPCSTRKELLERPQLPRARHHADDRAPARQGLRQDAGLARALQRQRRRR